MEKIALSKRYAKAIYDAALKNNQVFEVFETLYVLLEHINNDEDFRKFITYPTVEVKEKQQLICKLYKDIKENFSYEIIDYLIEKEKLIYLKEIYDEYTKIYYKAHQRLIVSATFPKELTEEQKLRLKRRLEKIKNKEVMIYYRVDKSLIGGGVIRINDDVIDGSIKTQLNALKNRQEAKL